MHCHSRRCSSHCTDNKVYLGYKKGRFSFPSLQSKQIQLQIILSRTSTQVYLYACQLPLRLSVMRLLLLYFSFLLKHITIQPMIAPTTSSNFTIHASQQSLRPPHPPTIEIIIDYSSIKNFLNLSTSSPSFILFLYLLSSLSL